MVFPEVVHGLLGELSLQIVEAVAKPDAGNVLVNI